MKKQVNPIKIKIKFISGNDWCLVLIFPTKDELTSFENKLNGEFETHLFLNETDTLLNVVINMHSNAHVYNFDNIQTSPPQRVHIESEIITGITFWHNEIAVPNDIHCRYTNVKYRQN